MTIFENESSMFFFETHGATHTKTLPYVWKDQNYQISFKKCDFILMYVYSCLSIKYILIFFNVIIRHLRKIAQNGYKIRHVRLSICLSVRMEQLGSQRTDVD